MFPVLDESQLCGLYDRCIATVKNLALLLVSPDMSDRVVC
jgi:hypothetical protein